MTKTNIKLITRQISYGFIAAVMLLSYFPSIASAAPITARKVVIGSSAASASTTYSFTFTVPSTDVIQSASFAACTTASGVCTPAPGFSASSSTLTGQPTNLGDAAGWTVSTGTAGELRLSKAGNVAAPTPATPTTVSFSNVTNPSAENATFYMRITTFSDATWTAINAIDTGVVASSTAGQVTVSVVIDESLTFTLADAAVVLSAPATDTTGTGSSAMTISTNASAGYTISYSGDTLTSGVNTLTAMSTPDVSTVDSKQFGINLRLNTTATSTPVVGADKTGTDGNVEADYNTVDQFMFDEAGDIIVTASLPSNSNTFTTSYIANMDGSTAAGVYSTIITYTATANF